jgi:hypothetical protein
MLADVHFAGLNTIHYLLKVLVFDLHPWRISERVLGSTLLSVASFRARRLIGVECARFWFAW